MDTKFFDNRKVRNVLLQSGFITLCESVGILGGLITSKSIPQWYSRLKKPSITPPSWIFAPVWAVLYTMMGSGAGIIVSKTERNRIPALILFSVQLLLNFLWTVLFFGFRNPLAALIELIVLFLSIVATIIAFWRISKNASILLLPYLLWVSFAVLLNFSIWKINAKTMH